MGGIQIMGAAFFRAWETRLAWFTLGVCVIYIPGETWISLDAPLWHPLFVIDVIAMVLLVWGAVHSLRARPRRSPGPMCAAYGWSAANAWRAAAARYYTPDFYGGGTRMDTAPMPSIVVAAIVLVIFAFSLYLTSRRTDP